MDWKLEVVVVPVTDVERAKSFYVGQLGFRLDADTQPTPAMRVVHMTPPGSGCSLVIGPKVVAAGTVTDLTAGGHQPAHYGLVREEPLVGQLPVHGMGALLCVEVEPGGEGLHHQ